MIRARLKERPLNYYDENGHIQRSADTINWVQWLADKNAKKEPDIVRQILDKCVEYATELAHSYALKSIEVFLSQDSLHFNYIKNSTLYTCVIPRSLIIKTLTIAPHMEKCVRMQLIREIKRIRKESGEKEGLKLKAVLPTYGRGWLPVYAASSTSMT